jgi:hypothetical protein
MRSNYATTLASSRPSLSRRRRTPPLLSYASRPHSVDFSDSDASDSDDIEYVVHLFIQSRFNISLRSKTSGRQRRDTAERHCACRRRSRQRTCFFRSFGSRSFFHTASALFVLFCRRIIASAREVTQRATSDIIDSHERTPKNRNADRGDTSEGSAEVRSTNHYCDKKIHFC